MFPLVAMDRLDPEEDRDRLLELDLEVIVGKSSDWLDGCSYGYGKLVREVRKGLEWKSMVGF